VPNNEEFNTSRFSGHPQQQKVHYQNSGRPSNQVDQSSSNIMSEEKYGRNNVTNPFAQTNMGPQVSAYSRPNDGENSAVMYD
jgi:hypothetical protein